MPKNIRKTFRIQGRTVHYRKRKTGRYTHSYEIRYAKKPYNNPPISVSGITLEEAKEKFIKKLNNYKPQSKSAPAFTNNFHNFAMYWFENFHKRKVGEGTYKKDLASYSNYIQKTFGSLKICDIYPTQIQNFLDSFEQKGRLKETLHSLLNQIFTCAIKHGIIKLNPLDMCFYQKHERKHGKSLTKDEERLLLDSYAGSLFQTDFAIILYTGLRPNEFATVSIENGFIKAKNSKRKNGKVEYKKIPISPMLEPYITGCTALHIHCPDAITNRLKEVLPNHMLYDLRTTFQTRCTECGISDVAIGLFMGNAIGGELKKAYTDISDEWLINEGKKLNY